MELEVTVAKSADGDGYRAVLLELPAMWSRGDSIEDVIANFKQQYDALPFDYKFVVKMEGAIG